MKNSVKDLRLLVILIGITMLVGIMYWEVDVNNEYNCITFLEKESDFELDMKVAVINHSNIKILESYILMKE